MFNISAFVKPRVYLSVDRLEDVVFREERELKLKRISATKIQATYRSYLARKRLSDPQKMQLQMDRQTHEEVKKRVLQSETMSKHLRERIGVIFHDSVSQISFFSEKTDAGKLKIYAFKKGEILGKGNFGSVYAINSIGEPILKSLSVVIKESTKIPQSADTIKNEYEILKQLWALEGIVGIQQMPCLVTNDDGKPVIFYDRFQFDLGKLTKTAGKDRKKIDCIELLKKFEMIFKGLTFLHNHNFIHGDIKPENMGVDEGGMFVLTDFGGATRCKDGDLKSVLPRVLNPYMSDIMVADVKYQIREYRELEKSPQIPERDKQLSNSQKKLIWLVKKIDVCALQMSIRQIFEGVDVSSYGIGKEFNELLDSMKNRYFISEENEWQCKESISIQEALKKWQEILSKLSSVEGHLSI